MKKVVDYYLQPPVSQFRLMAYNRAEVLAEVGFDYAVREIETWTKTL